jgi:hypothetical protein
MSPPRPSLAVGAAILLGLIAGLVVLGRGMQVHASTSRAIAFGALTGAIIATHFVLIWFAVGRNIAFHERHLWVSALSVGLPWTLFTFGFSAVHPRAVLWRAFLWAMIAGGIFTLVFRFSGLNPLPKLRQRLDQARRPDHHC